MSADDGRDDALKYMREHEGVYQGECLHCGLENAFGYGRSGKYTICHVCRLRDRGVATCLNQFPVDHGVFKDKPMLQHGEILPQVTDPDGLKRLIGADDFRLHVYCTGISSRVVKYEHGMPACENKVSFELRGYSSAEVGSFFGLGRSPDTITIETHSSSVAGRFQAGLHYDLPIPNAVSIGDGAPLSPLGVSTGTKSVQRIMDAGIDPTDRWSPTNEQYAITLREVGDLFLSVMDGGLDKTAFADEVGALLRAHSVVPDKLSPTLLERLRAARTLRDTPATS